MEGYTECMCGGLANVSTTENEVIVYCNYCESLDRYPVTQLDRILMYK